MVPVLPIMGSLIVLVLPCVEVVRKVPEFYSRIANLCGIMATGEILIFAGTFSLDLQI